MMEAIRSSETSVLTIVTRHQMPEEGILHSHRRENLKSYIRPYVSVQEYTDTGLEKLFAGSVLTSRWMLGLPLDIGNEDSTCLRNVYNPVSYYKFTFSLKVSVTI
jgi:hypothetical protein